MIELKNGDTCPACNNGKLASKKLDLPWQFGIFPKRRKTVFKDATVFTCDNCPESFFDKETNNRVFNWVEEVLNGFNK
jgi:hypothetical protein